MGRQVAFLDRLTAGERAALAASGRRAAFPRGAVLLVDGVASGRVFALESGQVKVAHTTREGRQVLVALRGAGDVLDVSELTEATVPATTVSAISDVTALVVACGVFRRYLTEHPRVAVELLGVVAERLQEDEADRVRIVTDPVERRLAHRLLVLAEEEGEIWLEGVTLRVRLSQAELASWIGASRATVNAVLRAFSARGLVTVGRRHLHIRDVDALRAEAEP